MQHMILIPELWAGYEKYPFYLGSESFESFHFLHTK
jgi:hypothetical protein